MTRRLQPREDTLRTAKADGRESETAPTVRMKAAIERHLVMNTSGVVEEAARIHGATSCRRSAGTTWAKTV